MPTSNYDPFARWLDDMFGSHIKTVSVNSISTTNEPAPVKAPKVTNPFEIQSVLSNRKKNAFTVVWADGTHTTVHCQPGDNWDDEKALAMCFTKKALGNKGNFNDKFNDALDNKRKVIPGGAGIIKMSDSSISFTRPITLNEEAVKRMTEAPEKACDCDGTCTECKCEKATLTFGINKQAVEDLQIGSAKASNSFKEMVEELVGMSNKTEEKPEPAHIYKVYLRIGGESLFDSNIYSIEALRKRIHDLAEELYGKKPYYYRTWMNGDRMQIDFGHHTQFIEVEGITPDEYAKN